MNFSAKKIFAVVLFVVFSQYADAVTKDTTGVGKNKSRKSLMAFYQYGIVLPSNEFVKGNNKKGEPIDRHQSFAVQFAVETNGRKLWQQLYNYPSWGVGLNTFSFFNTEELGNPAALYWFFNAPFVRFKKWSINYSIGSGVAFSWKPYDPEINPYNNAIGSKITGFVDMGIYFDLQLGKHVNLSTGIALNHFSNGAGKVPNLGINMAGARVSLKYIFMGRTEFIKREVIPKYKKRWEYLMFFSYSHKQIEFDTVGVNYEVGMVPQDYNIYNFSIGANRQLNYKLKLGLGMDFGYDQAYNSFITVDNQQITPYNAEGTKLAIGVYPSFEWVIDRLSVVVQAGYYIYRSELSIPEPTKENNVVEPRRIPSDFYQRIGFKYHFYDQLFIGINVRAYSFTVADYFEWSIGYRIIH